MTHFALTLLTKDNGPLTKRMGLNPDGSLWTDSRDCLMPSGAGQNLWLSLPKCAEMLPQLASNQAIALGRLRPDLPDTVQICTKRVLNELNGTRAPNLIARTADYIKYQPDQAALVLIDSDLKKIPPEIADRIAVAGGIIAVLTSIIPEIAGCAYLTRLSTSSMIWRADTQKWMSGQNGLHTYLLIKNGADAERFLRVLHDRCWLAGYGWLEIGMAGQFLSRSIVDVSVYAPERLVFEAPPQLDEPLRQADRVPVVHDGYVLDTQAIFRNCSLVETARLKTLTEQERRRLAPEAAIAKAAYFEMHVARIVARVSNCSPERARQIIECHIGGILLPDVVLPFDDFPEGVRIGDILADPEAFIGLTLPDPIEGLSYGPCKAVVMRRQNGSLWIRSFAHGLTTYDLKYDAVAVEAAIMAAPEAKAAELLIRLMLQAEVDQIEADRLRALACKRSGAQSRTLGAQIKKAKADAEAEMWAEARAAREARRNDQRIRLPVPADDAPWLPVMGALNDVLGNVGGPEPPMRNTEGRITRVSLKNIPSWHALTAESANAEENDTRLPATKQPLLAALSDAEIAELIELHIEFIKAKTDIEVQLPYGFVNHFAARNDNALPIVTGVATLPVVMVDGTLIAKQGLDRQSGTVFRIPQELLAILPKPEDCTDAAIKEAFNFLIHEFLVDVTTSTAGKSVAIALMLTLIQRMLIPERPVFFVTAGQRGGGKTTLLIMIIIAIFGIRPAAAAWSPNEEERRKSLMAYLLMGVPFILWDNILRGLLISCQHIEAACTSETKSDRNLGHSEILTAMAAASHIFTGNNIGPKGDMASRSLKIEIEVNVVNPENRKFEHPEPINWVEANRGKILAALYTILIGNENVRKLGSNSAAGKGRFKDWWRMIGRPVEYAAKLAGHPIDFGRLFLEQEDDDEEVTSLTSALVALSSKWRSAPTDTAEKAEDRAHLFTAADVTTLINTRHSITGPQENPGTVLWEFLFPDLASKTPNGSASSKAVGRCLTKHCGAPVSVIVDGKQGVLSLRKTPQTGTQQKEGAAYWLKLLKLEVVN